MSNHHRSTTTTTTTTANDFNETMKKTPSPRRQMTRSTSNINKEISSAINNNNNNNNNEQCVQVIKPVAVRPPSSDSTQNPYNLRSRSKLKNSNNNNNNNNTEVIPSFTEKLSLDTPIIQQKPVPPLTRAAAASAGVKIDSFISDESIRTNNKLTTTISTRSSTTRKRKASEDDHRPYLDLLKMKQTQSTYSFDGNSPKKITRRTDQDCIGVDDEDSGCDYDSPAHSPVDFTDVPPGHVFHYEESNMSYDSGFSTGSGEPNNQQYLSQSQAMSSGSNSNITTRSNTLNSHKYPAAIDLDVNAIEGDLGF
ncbi:unnamed protein product [Rotaria socialis]|uniref:Uncharacterized protein n=1 Tax=Rotaria socialis TaxID=392032 RepID=A0A821DNJ1_9BILA|nr:unnamed protein product [Rotaria socialis]CAF4624283.1 unnamed protein product [Rotaria socialis]